jgi:hypothetical protein
LQLLSEVHARILPVLRDGSPGPMPGPIGTTLAELRERLMQSFCVHAFLAYERYLDIFSIRTGNGDLQDQFTLVGSAFFEREFRKDPSQAGIVIGLALGKIRAGEVGRGRHLLRRIAASGFAERDLARQLLSRDIR